MWWNNMSFRPLNYEYKNYVTFLGFYLIVIFIHPKWKVILIFRVFYGWFTLINNDDNADTNAVQLVWANSMKSIRSYTAPFRVIELWKLYFNFFLLDRTPFNAIVNATLVIIIRYYKQYECEKLHSLYHTIHKQN